MGQMYVTDTGTTQDNFILPAPPVGGLPISQDWLAGFRSYIYILINICTETDFTPFSGKRTDCNFSILKTIFNFFFNLVTNSAYFVIGYVDDRN